MARSAWFRLKRAATKLMSDSDPSTTPAVESANPHAQDTGLDAASQSLADALRTTFRVLKAVMVLLIIAFLLSGLTRVDENEEAMVLRFGRPTSGVQQPGLLVALPYPIDETIRLPVKELMTRRSDMHWPASDRTPQGLDPMRDGALLTGDRGLVHVKWTMTYRIKDIEQFVRTVADSNVGQDERIESLLDNLLANAAVLEATGTAAIDIYPRSPEALAKRVRARLNRSLDSLGSGLEVVALDIADSTVPGPARQAFLNVTKQQSTRQKLIRNAQREAMDKLNGVAGAAHKPLLAALDRLDAARAHGDEAVVAETETQIDWLLENSVSGSAGVLIAEANAFYAQTVHGIRADVHEYEALLPEYRRSPELLITRLWQQTKARALSGPGVTKRFLPPGKKEIRITIGPDPMQKKLDERARLLEQHKHGSDDAPTAIFGRRGRP